MESEASIEEIVQWFDVTREQVVAVLEFAARSLDPPLPPNRLAPQCRRAMLILFDQGTPAR